jgi:hypothetical protein
MMEPIDLQTESENEAYINSNIDKLTDYFYNNNLATTDDPEEFEAWLATLSQNEQIEIIDGLNVE